MQLSVNAKLEKNIFFPKQGGCLYSRGCLNSNKYGRHFQGINSTSKSSVGICKWLICAAGVQIKRSILIYRILYDVKGLKCFPTKK